MKKKMLTSIGLIVAAALLFGGCGGGNAPEGSSPDGGTSAPVPDGTAVGTDETQESGTPGEVTTSESAQALTPRDPGGTYRVLFIGNSFTYYNDMNQPNGIFARIAKKAGYSGIKVTTVYKGGYYLHQFLDDSDSYGHQVLTLLGSSTKFDIVILQEQSANPIADPGDFYESCRRFKELIDKNGAEMWLYSTWGYKTGHSGLGTYGPTTEAMEMKLRAAYTAIAEELGVKVGYAGAAMTKCFRDHPEIDLYNSDLKHPSAAGSHLIAWTLFGTIFGVDPATLTDNADMTAAFAEKLKAAASDTVMNGAPVDPAYRTSSAGVKPVEKVEAVEGQVDPSKTVMLKTPPSSGIISVVTRDSRETGDGWMTLKSDSSKTFSGIRGDRDAVASVEYSATALTDAQKADIADRNYGVSVIGIEYMDSSKTGTDVTTAAGKMTSVGNLVNGHWGSSYMAAMFFDRNRYNVNGNTDVSAPYTALITLNFGKVMTFDAIGYFSGSLKGFAQAQDVYVSDNGEDWVKVEPACYDAKQTALASLDGAAFPDPWNQNKPTVFTAFSMGGASGKYIRIGIIKGGEVSSNNTGLMEINTREIAVFGSEKK